MTSITKRRLASLISASAVVGTFAVALSAGATMAAKPASPGFDQFGYNYNANIFSGPADGADKSLDGTVWGDPAYATDKLVMKWNDAWNECKANGFDDAEFCAGAWTTNQWNGNIPGGSGWTEHIKIIWVGSAGTASDYWVDGGKSIWGNYEVIFDHGSSPDHEHTFVTHGSPAGLGR